MDSAAHKNTLMHTITSATMSHIEIQTVIGLYICDQAHLLMWQIPVNTVQVRHLTVCKYKNIKCVWGGLWQHVLPSTTLCRNKRCSVSFSLSLKNNWRKTHLSSLYRVFKRRPTMQNINSTFSVKRLPHLWSFIHVFLPVLYQCNTLPGDSNNRAFSSLPISQT